MNIFYEIRDKKFEKESKDLDKELDKSYKMLEKYRKRSQRELEKYKKYRKRSEKEFEKLRKIKSDKKYDKALKKWVKKEEKFDKKWAKEQEKNAEAREYSFRTFISFKKLEFILPYIKSISPDSLPKSVSRLDSLRKKNDYETLEELVNWCNETLKKSPNTIYEEDPIMESESPDLYNEINDWTSAWKEFKSI